MVFWCSTVTSGSHESIPEARGRLTQFLTQLGGTPTHSFLWGTRSSIQAIAILLSFLLGTGGHWLPTVTRLQALIKPVHFQFPLLAGAKPLAATTSFWTRAQQLFSPTQDFICTRQKCVSCFWVHVWIFVISLYFIYHGFSHWTEGVFWSIRFALSVFSRRHSVGEGVFNKLVSRLTWKISILHSLGSAKQRQTCNAKFPSPRKRGWMSLPISH